MFKYGNPSAGNYMRSGALDWMQTLFEAAWNAAHVENRRRTRIAKRAQKAAAYRVAGLNGPRAVARRLGLLHRPVAS